MKPKYIPDMATVVRETDPRKVKAERQKAREDAQRPTPPGFCARYDAEEDSGADPARVSAPSPWANGAALGIDKAALPSAMAPAAGSEKTDATTPAPRAATAGARRTMLAKNVALGIAAGLTVAAFAVAMPKLTERQPRQPAGADATHAAEPAPARTGMDVAHSAEPAPARTGATPLPATPSAATATASSEATPPSATATAGSPRRVEPMGPGARTNKPRDAGDDPYDTASAAPPPSAPPSPPTAPSGAPSAPPPAITPSPTASSNHFDKPNYD
jgi:hypothetical protein